MDCYYLSSSSFPPKNNNAKDKKKKVPVGGGSSNNNKKIKTNNNNNGVQLSTDPQSVAARERRHRISDRFKVLQSMVPGGTKMDIVSMLDEAINYVKFLKTQILLHQSLIMNLDHLDPPNLLNYNYQIDPTGLAPSIFHPYQQPYCWSNLEYSNFVVINGSVQAQPPATTSYMPMLDYYIQGQDSVLDSYDHTYVKY